MMFLLNRLPRLEVPDFCQNQVRNLLAIREENDLIARMNVRHSILRHDSINFIYDAKG